MRFLIDTGADISVLPISAVKIIGAMSESSLYAANGTPIRTYGEKRIAVDLGLRRCFEWVFFVADVTMAILGADFLKHYKLLVDLANRKLRDEQTNLYSPGKIDRSNVLTVTAIDIASRFHCMLQNFTDLTKSFSRKEGIHNVQHHIITRGVPVAEKARRLPPNKCKAAKELIQQMIRDGISLANLIGAKRITTTTYHPASNGMIERWHRTLKTAIRCHTSSDWVYTLPSVLLGLRTSIKDDIEASVAELVYGTTLRLPGEFLMDITPTNQPRIFVEKLRATMREVRPTPAGHHQKSKTFVYEPLHTCTHVFIRVDSLRKPLEPPYKGPYPVLERINEKVYKVKIKGNPQIVSVERLKPAFLERTPTLEENVSEVQPPTRTYSIKKVKFALDLRPEIIANTIRNTIVESLMLSNEEEKLDGIDVNLLSNDITVNVSNSIQESNEVIAVPLDVNLNINSGYDLQ
ncbi:hypothetical protein KPH14_012574 [Odynerus spinipes]|uniref:Peptidase A2 domain-containing protein n=1 Tax=Odynerus spinipes TaxID=1348599 RepID=A0AAD9RFM0_9HYME|nr:hypothetical protein KPH14_012574 [Odynerus spinipes]